MSLKISRKALSLTEKLSILEKYDSNPFVQKTKLADSLNIAESTLRTIIVKRKEIEKRAIEGSTKRKKIKHGKYYTLEQILVNWINERHAESAPVNGPVIQRRALKIAKWLKITDFKATNGWLDRFKKRNLIRYRQVSRKSQPVNNEDKNFWFLNILPKFTEKYASNDIFNVTEFELCFKLMSNKLQCFKNLLCKTPCPKGKLSRELLKVLICANSDGTEKLNPLIIGKPSKPKCFINNKSLPCEYSVKTPTLMTNEHFYFWVKKLDQTMVKKNRKILLVVNSLTNQEVIGLTNVELVFFPPYIPKKHQPMDLGVVNALKQYYENHYLNVLKNSNTKQFNMTDALRSITEAWDSIQPQVIAECFKKAGIEYSNEVTDDTANELMESIKNTTTHLKKTNQDNENPLTTEHKDVQNIEDLVDISGDDNDIDEDDDSDSDGGQNETLSDAINAIKILRRYIPTLKGSEAAMNNVDCVERFIFSKMPNL